jgi:hypothetical protein
MGDLQPMLDDVQVISTQFRLAYPVHVEEVMRQLVKELGLAIVVDAFVPILAKPCLQRHQAVAVEMTQHPAV